MLLLAEKRTFVPAIVRGMGGGKQGTCFDTLSMGRLFIPNLSLVIHMFVCIFSKVHISKHYYIRHSKGLRSIYRLIFIYLKIGHFNDHAKCQYSLKITVKAIQISASTCIS